MAAINCLTSDTYSTASREVLQYWFRSRAGKPMTLIELSNGVTYCQLLTQLFPSVLDKKKVKQPAGYELDRVHNWKLFQQALRRLKVTKEVNILERIKPHSSGNLDFCRWFISFYEANNDRPQLTQSASSTSTVVLSRRGGMRLHVPPMGDGATASERGPANGQDEGSLSPTGLTPTRRPSTETCPRTVTINRENQQKGGWMDEKPEDYTARDTTFVVTPSRRVRSERATTPILWEEDESANDQETAKEQEMDKSPTKQSESGLPGTPYPDSPQMDSSVSDSWMAADEYFKEFIYPDPIENDPDPVDDELSSAGDDLSSADGTTTACE